MEEELDREKWRDDIERDILAGKRISSGPCRGMTVEMFRKHWLWGVTDPERRAEMEAHIQTLIVRTP